MASESAHVLIVDDNRALAENLGEILELEGFLVDVRSEPRDLMREAPAFDAAVVDVRMGDIDGIELCQALQKNNPDAAYVLMTAFTREERAAQASRCARVVLAKPFPPERLVAELRSALAERAAHAR